MKSMSMTTGQKIGAGFATGGLVFLVVGLVNLFKKSKSDASMYDEEDNDTDDNEDTDEESESSEDEDVTSEE